VSTPVFEGPFDVLLQLVQDHKVDVYDIRVADIVDAFVAEVAARQPLDLQVATEFLVIAAILVELKSRKLLPGPDEVEDDEELCGFEERDRLLARLLELQAYAAAADAFALLTEQAARSLPRTAGLEEAFRDLAPDLLVGVTPDKLAAAFLRGMTPRIPLDLDLAHVTVEAVTVSEAVSELVERLPGEGRASFRALTAHCTTRMQIIVRFLALLELCKQGRVALEQGETFGDLEVSWTGPEAGAVDHGGEGVDAVAAGERAAAAVLSPVGVLEGVEEYDG
jgi:segregation and condensation protein A